MYFKHLSKIKTCQRLTKLFMEDFLQNELHERNVMLTKVN